MAVRKEHYVVTTRLFVPFTSPRPESIVTNAVEVPCANGTLHVGLSQSVDPIGTAIEIRWVFEDWFTEETGSDVAGQQTIFELWEVSHALCLPTDKGFTWVDFRSLDPAHESLRACRPYLNRYALCTRWPALARRLRSSTARDLDAVVTIEVAGRSTTMRSQVFSGSLQIPSTPMTEDFARAIAGSYPSYVTFLSTADRRYLDGDVPDAVVHLAQGLEVAAYSFGRSIDPTVTWRFSAPHFFGPAPHRNETISSANPAVLPHYPAICELFGSRHEWVHEGRAQVRPFEDSNIGYTKDQSQYRALTRNDYLSFRTAVSSALEWMGELPIELPG